MRRKKILMTVTAVLAAVGILLPFRPTVVLGHSMAPTMRSGGLYLVNTRYYQSHPIRRGDVVVFHYRGETCTKRVYALPGERVLLLRYDDGDGAEVVTGAEAVALRRIESHHRLVGSLKEMTVPPGHCFVLGDNLPVSWDSRAFGWLPVGTILGRVSL